MPSSNTTVEPAAVKKRGRPKKVVAEDAGKPLAAEAKKTTTTVKKATVKTVVAKDKIAEPKKEKKMVTTKDAPAQATPVTPAASKILDEVRAKGTWKKTLPTKASKTESGDVIKTAAAVQSKPASLPSSSQANPGAPTSPSIQEAQTKPPPTQHTITSTTSPPTQQRITTIPLPRKPLLAPSPHHSTLRSSSSPSPSSSSSSSSATPNPTSSSLPQNPYPGYLHRRPPGLSPQHTRIIEPTPDIRLPPKYKPAARRVTAIIVSLPIVIVFGYELWARWRGKEVARKFGDGPRERNAKAMDMGKGEEGV